MSTLRERLEQVIADGLVKDASAWSEAAGLTKGHVSTLLRRLQGRSEEEENAESMTMRALARAANISPGWLTYGEGDRQADRFRNRAFAARLARRRGILEAAIREVETAPDWQKPDLSTRRVAWWSDEIHAVALRLEREAAQAVVRRGQPSSKPPEPVATTTKRRAAS